MRSKLVKQLIKTGYTLYDDPLHHSEGEYQKKIVDEQGIKYFINFYQYNSVNAKNKITSINWEIRIQFQLSISMMNINLFTFKDDSKLLDIEYFIEGLFERLDAHYYEEN